MTTRTFSVDGMSCGHCVNAITEEVSKVGGVASVDVDLGRKTVTVCGDPLDDAALTAAIDEAGFSVVG